MIRVNLLPKDIQEKRRYERYFIWVYITAAVAVFLIFGAWLVLSLQINSKNDDLQSRQELASQLRSEADAYSVFEEKKAALDARQEVAKQALSGRVNWAKAANEVSLVLPADVWTTGITANQETGMSLSLVARDVKDSPDVGQKAVARTMVRLNDLDTVYNVWLTSSVRSDPAPGTSEGTVAFQVSTLIFKPTAAGATTSTTTPASSGQ